METIGRNISYEYSLKLEKKYKDNFIISITEDYSMGCGRCDLDTIMDPDDRLCWDCETGRKRKNGYKVTRRPKNIN